MARIIVFDDAADPDVFMNEPVAPEHLRDENSAAELLERLSRAVDHASRRRAPTRVQAVTPYTRVRAS